MNHNPNTPYEQDPISFTEEEPHLSDYVKVVWRRKWLVLALFVAVVSIITVKTFMTTPLYKAASRIIIESEYSTGINIEDPLAKSMANADFFQTQYDLLQSRSLARAVIEELELWDYLAPPEVETQETSVSLPGEYEGPENASGVSSADVRPVKSEKVVTSKMVDSYLGGLEITPTKGNQLVDISFTSPAPEIAVRVSNAHARKFIQKNVESQNTGYMESINWLKSQLQEQKEFVESSQRAISDYNEDLNIIPLEEQKKIMSQKLMELNNILTHARSEQRSKKNVYDQLETFSLDRENPFSLPGFSKEGSVLHQLRLQLAGLKSEKSQLATVYRAKHPKTLEINARIEQQEQDIIAEVEQIKMAAKVELDRAVTNTKSIQKALDEQKQIAMSLNKETINLEILRREVESNQNVYDILLKQAREASLISDMKRSNIRIIDKAEMPREPVTPRKKRNLLIAVVLGAFSGVGLAFFLAYMDKTVRTPEEVTRRLGLPVIGMLAPDRMLEQHKQLVLPSGESMPVKGKSKDDYSHYYNVSGSLVSGFPVMRSGNSGQVFLVESSVSGEGKTTVTAKSAISLAKGGLRVVMVDNDLQRSTLGKIFGLADDENRGLRNTMTKVLSQDIQYGDLNTCSVDDLFFLISLRKESGHLVVTNETQSMTLIFKDGQLFHLRNKHTPDSNRLGTMMLRGGFITESQLEDAVERNKRTGQPLGYILVNSGFISFDKLKGPVKLQMEEHLQKLFSWKHGTFTFQSGSIETHDDKMIYFKEDYSSTINELSSMTEGRFLESAILENVKSLDEQNLSLLTVGTENKNKVQGSLYYTLLEKVLSVLKQRYDVVLVDSPPMLQTGGIVKPVLSMVDGVIFVIKSGKATIKQVNEATSIIKESNTNIVGTVLNQVKVGKEYYGYYDYYHKKG